MNNRLSNVKQKSAMLSILDPKVKKKKWVILVLS